MRRISKNYPLLMFMALGLFAACDIVDEPIPADVKNKPRVEVGFQDSILSTFTLADFPTIKKVYIEEFTGHQCVNCPAAAEKIHDLEQLFGDKLVTIAIHATSLADPIINGAKYSYDFKCPEGEEIAQHYNVSFLPIALIDRTPSSFLRFWSTPQWEQKISDLSLQPQTASVAIRHSYDPVSRKLQIAVLSRFLPTAAAGSYNLSVMLKEDSIVSWQKDNRVPSGDVEFYRHDGNMRTAVNSTFGELIMDGTPDTDSIYSKFYSRTLDTDWVAGQMSIVAFVYNVSTEVVLQAEGQKLVINQ